MARKWVLRASRRSPLSDVVSGESDFDTWLEQQLRMTAGVNRGQHPMPAQARYQAAFLQQSNHVPVIAKVAGLLSAKAAIGLTLGVLAVSAAGAGEAAITGSANPTAWGQQLVQQVEKCKDALAPGTHGIGNCVSTFASQHGAQVSSDHRASGARTSKPTPGSNDKPKNQGGGSGNGQGNGNSQGHGDGHGGDQGNGGGQGQGGGGGHGSGSGGGHGTGKS